MPGRRRIGLIFSMMVLIMFAMPGLSGYAMASEDKKIPKVGPMRMNSRPASLEGKTVLLRWNGKYNGDKFLSRVGELIPQQVKSVKIIKWLRLLTPGTGWQSGGYGQSHGKTSYN
jgi:hypothetical protein